MYVTFRANSLFAHLRPDKSGQGDPQAHIDTNSKLFNLLAQIRYLYFHVLSFTCYRILIDQRTMQNEMPLASILEDLYDMSDPVVTKPQELIELENKFKENKLVILLSNKLVNRKKLSDLSCDLKLLDWTAAVSDPGQLKRVDKMQIIREPTHH